MAMPSISCSQPDRQPALLTSKQILSPGSKLGRGPENAQQLSLETTHGRHVDHNDVFVLLDGVVGQLHHTFMFCDGGQGAFTPSLVALQNPQPIALSGPHRLYLTDALHTRPGSSALGCLTLVAAVTLPQLISVPQGWKLFTMSAGFPRESQEYFAALLCTPNQY